MSETPESTTIGLGSPVTSAEFALLGWEYYSHRDFQKAEDALREALRIDQDNLDALFALGLVYKAAQDQTRAVETFKQVASAAQYLENHTRGTMIHRLAVGHIHDMETGNWNLEREIWQRKTSTTGRE